MRVFHDRETERSELEHWLSGPSRAGVNGWDVAILVGSAGQRADFDRFGVQVICMHDAKGAEFQAVAVAGLDHDILPDEKRMLNARDEAQLDEVMNTERHLLYVAATRGRDFL